MSFLFGRETKARCSSFSFVFAYFRKVLSAENVPYPWERISNQSRLNNWTYFRISAIKKDRKLQVLLCSFFYSTFISYVYILLCIFLIIGLIVSWTTIRNTGIIYCKDYIKYDGKKKWRDCVARRTVSSWGNKFNWWKCYGIEFLLGAQKKFVPDLFGPAMRI